MALSPSGTPSPAYNGAAKAHAASDGRQSGGKEHAANGDSYVALEDGDPLGEDYELPPIEGRGRFWAQVVLGFLATAIGSLVAYDFIIPPELHSQAKECAMLASIPIVALFFTWFHIWLAIQMMFLPLKFWGCCQVGDTGIGLGWQGVVPRKALKMAKTAFKQARPYLLGPRQWLERVDPKVLVAKTRPQLEKIISNTLDTVARQHFRELWEQQLPASVQQEMVIAALEQIEETSPSLWSEFTELLAHPEIGMDNDGMVVMVFTENKELLNSFFLRMGEREFRFIEHCGAALGFVCGCVQLAAWREMQGTARNLLLPMTGFFLGIVTNWMAIQMCFRPILPYPVHIAGRHICDIQGLFLKRQREVCTLYSKMLVDHFFNFTKVVEYLQRKDELWSCLVDAYLKHNTHVLRKMLGPVAARLAPMVLGRETYGRLEKSIQMELVEKIAADHEMHRVIQRHIAISADIFRSNRDAMIGMPSDDFEKLLHPVFQEDEWILILLGGVLGVIAGLSACLPSSPGSGSHAARAPENPSSGPWTKEEPGQKIIWDTSRSLRHRPLPSNVHVVHIAMDSLSI